jgi:hypothetical protein
MNRSPASPSWWRTRGARFSSLAAVGLALVVASSAFALPAQASTFTTSTKPAPPTSTGWVPVPDGYNTFQLPGGEACADSINVAVVFNKEYMDTTTYANGTTIVVVKGPLVLTFTNATTNQRVVRDESGTTVTTTYPNGSGIEAGTGNNYWGFGPQSQINTKEPGLVFTKGPVAITFNGIYALHFYLWGTQVDGCKLLGAS